MNANWAQGKLLLSDIDGTFLSESADAMQRNFDAVKAFTAAGGRFAFSSGRINVGMIIPNYREMVNAPLILANGALIIDPDGTILREEILDDETALWIEKTLCAAYPEHAGHELHKNELTGAIYKVVFYTRAEYIPGMYQIVHDRFGDTLEYAYSCPTLIEFMNAGTSKGNALLRIKNMYQSRGVGLTVYAVGDYQNDADMLAKADVSACPANASDEIKKISQWELCRNDQGAIADLIEHIRKESNNENSEN